MRDEFVLTAGPPPVVPVPVSVAPIANAALLVWYDLRFPDFWTIADRSGNGRDAQVNGTVDVAKGVSGGLIIPKPTSNWPARPGGMVAPVLAG